MIRLEKILKNLELNNRYDIIDSLELPSSNVIALNRGLWFLVENIIIKEIKDYDVSLINDF